MPAFHRLNPPQRPYTALSCSNGSTLRSGATHCLVEGSRLQTPKRPAAALHTVLLTLQGYHLRASQPLTHCLVGAARVPAFKPLNAPQQPTQCFAEASTQNSRLPAFQRVNPPQRPYTLYCWGVTPFADLQTRTVRSRTTHSVVGGSRVPFASLQTFIQTVTPSAAALHTVLLRPQDHRLLAFDPWPHCLVGASKEGRRHPGVSPFYNQYNHDSWVKSVKSVLTTSSF